MNHAITVDGLEKSFDTVHAVRRIHFHVKKGTLFAFLGPNGAGKSTTIDLLSTQIKPDAGHVTIDGLTLGQDDRTIRQKIGIVFQDSVLDPLLSAKENLFARGALYGMEKRKLASAVDLAAQTADIKEFWTRPYGKLSGGQRRRTDIARALINTPSILFLDEPTTGLDPQTRHKVWDTIRLLQQQHGMTIFLTTHYMEEAARADYITILDHGSIRAEGTPAELKEQYTNDVLKLTPLDHDALLRFLRERHIPFGQSGGDMIVNLAHTIDAIDVLQECRPFLSGLEVRRGTMDDVFLNITGAEVRD